MISVIVCTYNRCESLRVTLEAIQQQCLGEGVQLETVVVDNNSRDRTKSVVEALAARSAMPIRYVFEPKQGLSRARNCGIAEARGEILAFTDDDVIPEPRWIAALVEASARYGADCVGGKVLPAWLAAPPEWLVSERLRKHLRGLLVWLDHGPEPIVAQKPDPVFLFGANMAFRKAVFEEVGPFRTELGRSGSKLLSGDESELLIRLFDAGKRIVYTPHAVVAHKIEPERMRLGYARRWQFYAGRSRVVMARDDLRRLPNWLIRECLQQAAGALGAYTLRRREEGIERELVFWSQLGQIVEQMSQRRRPRRLDGQGC